MFLSSLGQPRVLHTVLLSPPGERAGRCMAVGASASSSQVSSRHHCPDGWHRRVSSLFRADTSSTILMGSLCPGHCWLSPACAKPCDCLFKGLIFGRLLWRDYWGSSFLQQLLFVLICWVCLAYSVALKRESLLTSELVVPVSFALQI